MTRLDSLPTELLIEIFKLATHNPVRNIDSLVSWHRFEPIYAEDSNSQFEQALRTKYAVSLVCSLFRRLSLELLYEDIRIRHGSDGLIEALESSKKDLCPGLGGYVKRVSLSFASGDDTVTLESQRTNYELARRVLLCCPNVCAICRPQETFNAEPNHQEAILVGLPIDDLNFPLLHRVDWYNTFSNLPFASATAPRFIWNSNTLQVLMVGADNFPEAPDETSSETIIDLPNVHTLGIRSFNTFGSEQRRYSLSLPRLSRLIVGRPEAIFNFYSGCLARLGPQIRELELEPEPRFLRHDFLTVLLGYCPNAIELCFAVTTTQPANPNKIPRIAFDFPVRHVYLHTGLPQTAATYDQNDLLWWALLQGHFESLCAPATRFTALESIVLCGTEWKEMIEDVRLTGLVRLARSRGVLVECENRHVQGIFAKRTEDLGRLKV